MLGLVLTVAVSVKLSAVAKDALAAAALRKSGSELALAEEGGHLGGDALASGAVQRTVSGAGGGRISGLAPAPPRQPHES